MRGGVPGKYPDFDGVPHWMPFRTLYDPFKYSKSMSDSDKQVRERGVARKSLEIK